MPNEPPAESKPKPPPYRWLDSNGVPLTAPAPWLDGPVPAPGQVAAYRPDYHWELDCPDGIVTPEAVAAMLAKLSPRQRFYAVLRLEGAGKKTAARRIAATDELVRGWERSPWFPLLLEHYTQSHLHKRPVVLNPLVPLAAKAVGDALRGSMGDGARLETAKFVLEMAFGRPGILPAVTLVQKSDTPQTVQSLTDFIRAVDAARRTEQSVDAAVQVVAPADDDGDSA